MGEPKRPTREEIERVYDERMAELTPRQRAIYEEISKVAVDANTKQRGQCGPIVLGALLSPVALAALTYGAMRFLS